MARPRVRVKICGIKTPEDGLLAAAAGADAVGLNFHAPSPTRRGRASWLPDIAAALPPFVATVAVFVDPPAHLVEAVLNDVRPDCPAIPRRGILPPSAANSASPT